MKSHWSCSQNSPSLRAVGASRSTITVVTASIVVEREGQKGIVVGKGGSMIREIGKAAREELERELGKRLFLER